MQTLICRGKVAGNTIILEHEPGLPNGTPVEVQLHPLVDAEEQEKREEALQRILSLQLSVSDWEQMEEEIIRGATEQ
ncbi:hypothetical protein HRbin16_03260 [bacterium HR16]|nr:hypothetical protein HRbin16_03260 [bacterium HR16]